MKALGITLSELLKHKENWTDRWTDDVITIGHQHLPALIIILMQMTK